MTYLEALDYLNSLQYFGIKFGLNNIKVLLNLLGNPHYKFKAVHIAGTNGKGSVAAFTGSIAALSGYKVGVYTSPHLIDFRERIAIKTQSIRQESEIVEKLIPKAKIVSIVSDIKRAVKHMRNSLKMNHPTYFEIITALAFKYFADEKIDVLICETGMGGRLDATNVCSSIISVITNVALEHTDVLGKRITDIAYEKACIIKKNNVVISGGRKQKALDIISDIARKKGAKLVEVNSEYKWGRTSSNINRQGFWIKGNNYSYNDLEISLLGEHQVTNAVTAVAVAEKLRLFGFKVHENAIKTGLSSTIWQGRFQVLRKNPLMICDGAHNPSSARVLKQTISEIEYDRLIFIIGILKEKNYRDILRILLSEDATVIFTDITDTNRALSPEILAQEAQKFTSNVLVKKDISSSLKYAFQKANRNDLICVTGSLYLVGELLKGIKNLGHYNMNTPQSEIIIYQSSTGNIKVEVRLEEENVWLTQKLMAELFQVKPQNITMHLKNIYDEGELGEKATCKDYLQVQTEGNREVEQYLAFAETMAQQHTSMYMKDWIDRLDNILQLNGRELLTHAGKISHEMAIEKSNQELEKYKEEQKRLTSESSLKELEDDIKQIANRGEKDKK